MLGLHVVQVLCRILRKETKSLHLRRLRCIILIALVRRETQGFGHMGGVYSRCDRDLNIGSEMIKIMFFATMRIFEDHGSPIDDL